MASSPRASAVYCFCFCCEEIWVSERVCFTGDDFGESCPQREKKPKDPSAEGILGIVGLTPRS